MCRRGTRGGRHSGRGGHYSIQVLLRVLLLLQVVVAEMVGGWRGNTSRLMLVGHLGSAAATAAAAYGCTLSEWWLYLLLLLLYRAVFMQLGCGGGCGGVKGRLWLCLLLLLRLLLQLLLDLF